MPALYTLVWPLFTLVASASLRSVLLSLVAGVVLLAFRVRSAPLRHAVWSIVLIAMLSMQVLLAVVPPLPFWSVFGSTVLTTGSTAVSESLKLQHRPWKAARGAIEPASRAPMAPPPVGAPLGAAPAFPPLWATAICSIYLAVSCALFLRLLLGYRLIRRLRARSTLVCDPEVAEVISNLAAAACAPARLAEVRESSCVSVPLTLGWWRPVILLTADWRQWHAWKLRAVLSHELAHVRRRDWLVNLLASLNVCLFWFHPLAWWLGWRLTTLAEQASDEASLLASGDAAGYARMVLDFAADVRTLGRRTLFSSPAMAYCRSLSSRIDRILSLRHPAAGILRSRGWVAIAGCCIPLVYLFAAAQPQGAALDPPPMPIWKLAVPKWAAASESAAMPAAPEPRAIHEALIQAPADTSTAAPQQPAPPQPPDEKSQPTEPKPPPKITSFGVYLSRGPGDVVYGSAVDARGYRQSTMAWWPNIAITVPNSALDITLKDASAVSHWIVGVRSDPSAKASVTLVSASPPDADNSLPFPPEPLDPANYAVQPGALIVSFRPVPPSDFKGVLIYAIVPPGTTVRCTADGSLVAATAVRDLFIEDGKVLDQGLPDYRYLVMRLTPRQPISSMPAPIGGPTTLVNSQMLKDHLVRGEVPSVLASAGPQAALLSLIVDENGRASVVDRSGDPVLADAFARIVSGWQFNPITDKGERVAVRAKLGVRISRSGSVEILW